ncbi:MAG: PIG-L family deacetylase [Oscillospiraceae bacterium]|nr:PIG-L family deacetylase [Oscillospiraceae bacterium]
MKRKLLIFIIAALTLCLLITLALFLDGERKTLAPVSGQTAETPGHAPLPASGPSAEETAETSEESAPLPTGEPQYGARQLELTADTNAVAFHALFDENYYTDYTFPAGTALTLTAGEKIVSLYIVFGTYPGEWTLTAGGTQQLCGRDGYLHEFVALASPSATVEIALSAEKAVMIRDIYAFSEGYLPSFVQTWQTLEGGADILVFSTHYDDELLFFGGLIPYYSAVRGARVQVAYMTSNYLTDFSNYRFRPHEALNGLWIAGTHFYPVTNEVPDYECTSYWDAVSNYGEDQFVEFQVEQIRRFKPLVVVTQAEDGEYGHGAHILTALSVERAVEAAADPAQFPASAERYGVWDTPKTYLHYYGDPDEITWLSYEMPAEALGWKSPFQTAQEAYRQHMTQQQWEGFYVYGFFHPYDCHRMGLYRSLVGPDEAKNDLLEHVSRERFPFE